MNHSGNPRGRQPQPKRLIQSQIEAVKPPHWFTPYATQAFNQLKPLVADRATLDDMPLFFSMCTSYGKIMESEESIKTHGLTVVNDKGVVCKNPLWSVQKEACQVFNALCVKFALSPVDRARATNGEPASDKDSPMAQLLLKQHELRG